MSEFPETSQNLIARVKDSADAASWAEFLGIYQPVLIRMARRRGLQDADAHDVTQQVFLSISRSIENWTAGNDQPPFRAWLTTVAKNAITKALTRRPRGAIYVSRFRVTARLKEKISEVSEHWDL